MNKIKRVARAKKKARYNRLRRTGDVQMEALSDTQKRLKRMQEK